MTSGMVEEIMVREGEFVYEWEPLFSIKTKTGALIKVKLGASGKITTIKVSPGEQVITDMTLAILEEDIKPSGCD